DGEDDRWVFECRVRQQK
nr:hypothetical protein [Tanacetum cinerariifolium]